MKFDNLVTMADKVMMYKYVIKNVAKKYDKTVTFMPKPLFGDNGSGMHTHVSIWKGEPAAVCRQRLRRPERHGPVCHRRPAQARPGHPGLQLPHDQQLQAPGPRLRGPGEPGLLAAEPLGGHPHPHVQPEPQDQAAGVPLPRSELQSLPLLLGDPHGHASTASRTRSIRASRWTRTSTTSRRRNWPRFPRRRARWRSRWPHWRPTTTSSSAATSSPRT